MSPNGSSVGLCGATDQLGTSRSGEDWELSPPPASRESPHTAAISPPGPKGARSSKEMEIFVIVVISQTQIISIRKAGRGGPLESSGRRHTASLINAWQLERDTAKAHC